MIKKILIVLGFIAISSSVFFLNFCGEIKDKNSLEFEARQSSVQPMFDVPVIKLSFTESLSTKNVDEIIKEILEEERYENVITPFEKWGVAPIGKNKILLGSLVPEYAKFPNRIIIVYKTENIKLDYTNYEEDTLTISELANVSPKIAKEIINNLNAKGYSVTKENELFSDVELLWFRDGWNKEPIELNWKVTLTETDDNLITGYDTRGILEIKPTQERVRVSAGYISLKDKFKPKSEELLKKEKEIEELRKKLKITNSKRDISKATLTDLKMGKVRLERFWYRTAASGIFLGNKKVISERSGFQKGELHYLYEQEKAFILTNAHVAELALRYEVHISEDKEVMWVILPAYSSIRYTQDSDMWGSPAQVLVMDDRPVMSFDYDCAIMVTSKVPYFDNQVLLGDSDKVKEGDKVLMVGNPSMLQKFLTVGRVANTNYSLMKSHLVDYFLGSGLSRILYNWILNTNFWFDTPIGTGGTSGSGVWALTGSQKGKVIALHHAGMVRPSVFASDIKQSEEVSQSVLNLLPDKSLIEITKDEWKKVAEGFNYTTAKFSIGRKEFNSENPSFSKMSSGCEISGLNAGIKINNIKRFLQERGLDPKEFGWDTANDSYWQK